MATAHSQTYEVIGETPSVGVPTHFAKVVLASRPDFAYPQQPNPSNKEVTSPSTVKELAMGAFILPNKEIPDGADLRSFITPSELSGANHANSPQSRLLSALLACSSSTTTSSRSHASSALSRNAQSLFAASTTRARSSPRRSELCCGPSYTAHSALHHMHLALPRAGQLDACFSRAARDC